MIPTRVVFLSEEIDTDDDLASYRNDPRIIERVRRKILTTGTTDAYTEPNKHYSHTLVFMGQTLFALWRLDDDECAVVVGILLTAPGDDDPIEEPD